MPYLIHLLVSLRTLLLVVVHIGLFLLSYFFALALRFDFQIPGSELSLFQKTWPALVLAKLVVFHRFGSFHGWWRYVTFDDLAALLRASCISSALLFAVDFLFFPQFQVSRAVVLLDFGLLVLLIGGLRSTWRIWHEHVKPMLLGYDKRPALLIGQEEGAALVRQLHNHPTLNLRIVGFLDDNRSHHGSLLGGVPFLDVPENAVKVAQDRNVFDILIIANSISGTRLRKLMEECKFANIRLKIIPSLEDLLNSSYRISVRDVDINDLLRRQPVQLDTEHILAMLQGHRVMVTGAGGSIGSEICRQIARHQPSALILVERFENNLFHIERELDATYPELKILPCVADIRDDERMEMLFQQHQPRIVFHAAAHKHVPLMEYNPGEAVKNNVLGTRALVDLAEKHKVERFVMISTDKAVNPTSVMGVTKQLAERYVHACSENSITKFVVVRFGNVLASAGSVVPIFQEQIRRGGPVTVTHPEMRRYFMTIPEASQLVLQAASMGKGGEIFVLDMGEPVRILDLAQDLIRLSGFRPEDIPIEFVGMRPGEKLFEELYLDDEATLPTPHAKLKVAYHRSYGREEVLKSMDLLEECLHAGQAVIRGKLKELAPEYCPLDDASQPTPVLAGEGQAPFTTNGS
jgi:FlaA1/EpsC-like NDP-sugar epimerase